MVKVWPIGFSTFLLNNLRKFSMFPSFLDQNVEKIWREFYLDKICEKDRWFSTNRRQKRFDETNDKRWKNEKWKVCRLSFLCFTQQRESIRRSSKIEKWSKEFLPEVEKKSTFVRQILLEDLSCVFFAYVNSSESENVNRNRNIQQEKNEILKVRHFSTRTFRLVDLRHRLTTKSKVLKQKIRLKFLLKRKRKRRFFFLLIEKQTNLFDLIRFSFRTRRSIFPPESFELWRKHSVPIRFDRFFYENVCVRFPIRKVFCTSIRLWRRCNERISSSENVSILIEQFEFDRENDKLTSKVIWISRSISFNQRRSSSTSLIVD